MRSGVGASFIVTLLAMAAPAPEARAALVWDPAGPTVRLSVGMTAVLVDPTDPRIVWVGGDSSVWVSDDEGETWSLVLEMSGRNRADDPEEDDADDDDDEGGGGLEDPTEEDGTSLDPTAAPGEADPDEELPEAQTAEEVEFEVGARLERLRVIDEHVYACGGRGLWAIHRSARALGTGREIRFGRRQVVLDVAQTQPGSLWIATARGLHAGGLSTTALPVFGPLGNQPVRALHAMPRGTMLAAAPSGLWQLDGARFDRLGLQLGSRQIEDFAAAPGGPNVWALTRRVAHRLELRPRQDGAGDEWLLGATLATPAVRRIAVSKDGRVWIAGSSGVWEAPPGEPFSPRRQGLRTTLLYDVAAPASGKVQVWVAGQTGSARLVSEVERIWSQRAREMASRLDEDMPSAWETVAAAQRGREADFSHIDRWKVQRATSWLLPEVNLLYQIRRERYEGSPFIPPLGRFIIDDVRVVPAYEDLRITATWDLAAIVFGWIAGNALDDAPVLARVRQAQRDRKQIVERVLPLYNEWVTRQLERKATEPQTVRQAIREQLQLELVEADLVVHTDGWFPRTVGAGASTGSIEPQGGTP
jgi:hypothetical protein